MLGFLRLIICGSVDDGKSTLIGRLLWEANQVSDDHLRALERDSARYGTQGEAIDFALLVDGLQSEREQSITIDVAYRFFATATRRFMVADTPGHEQYTRNMATGASGSDLAVLVVNAATGLRMQTYRHARIVSLLGIRHLVVAVNKMDLVDWGQPVFSRIVDQFRPITQELKFESFQAIPVSALKGDNITRNSSAATWYRGLPLLEYLNQIDIGTMESESKFRMAVQLVNRPNSRFRGYCGRIASGGVRVGERIRVFPKGYESTILSIVVWQAELAAASSGDSVTLCLEDDLDICRGDVFASVGDPVEVSDHFEAHLICLSDHDLIPGRSYIFKLHSCQAMATILVLKCRLDIQTGHQDMARTLSTNDIGIVHLSVDRSVPFEPYSRCRRLGSFILIDRFTNETVAAGMIDSPLGHPTNIRWQVGDIDKRARAEHKVQRPRCIWFTGLSGSGKSTIANLLEKCLYSSGKHTYILDGDNIRHGLSQDLGFTEADRVENIRRAIEVARLLVDAGLLTLVAFISPYREERATARSRFEPGEFIEVFVDASLEECERRDPKGLYAKARRGELANFTGIDSPYEDPEAPDIHLDTTRESPEECVDRILHFLDQRPHLSTSTESKSQR